jgi:hypothetical protein
MKIIKEFNNVQFPFKWINQDYYPNSDAFRREIYIVEGGNCVEGLINLFYFLFEEQAKDILLYQKSWWDFCIDTWDIITDTSNYDLEDKSNESVDYLNMLASAEIKKDYSGTCECLNWNLFLTIVLKCIISHKALYSPLFYNEKNDFFFYFHHTGSIGIYFHAHNTEVDSILKKASERYEVVL